MTLKMPAGVCQVVAGAFSRSTLSIEERKSLILLVRATKIPKTSGEQRS